MKKFILKISVITVFLAFSLSPVWSQPPPPALHAATSDQASGAGAPIGSGTLLLLGMAALYGGRKIYDMHSSENEE